MSNNLSEENQQLLEEKIALLEKERILETRADERFRLDQEIKELKGKSFSFNPLKIHKNQYVIFGIFVLLAIILAIWALKKPTSVEQPKQVEETPTTVIQNPTNHGIAIQGNGTINIHQNNPNGETK
jgi:hypothetical protein